MYETWNAEDMDAFRERHNLKVTLRLVEGWPEPAPDFGREAVLRQFEQIRETPTHTVTRRPVIQPGRQGMKTP